MGSMRALIEGMPTGVPYAYKFEKRVVDGMTMYVARLGADLRVEIEPDEERDGVAWIQVWDKRVSATRPVVRKTVSDADEASAEAAARKIVREYLATRDAR